MPAAGVAVLIPWRPDPSREPGLAWVLGRYRSAHPEWEIVLCPAPDGPWCKGRAINDAVRGVSAETVIVADADCWTPNLSDAVKAVGDGAGWVVPHRRVMRLSRDATRHLIAGEHPRVVALDEPAYTGIQGGGITVLPAGTLIDIPIDERFTGWGQEDISWGIALHHLIGPAVRLTADLWHLWHPPQERQNRKIGNAAGHALYRRYCKARRDPAEMRQLVKEARP